MSTFVSDQKIFGLIELDTSGMVVYAKIERDRDAGGAGAPDIMGRNFYSEVAPFKNVEELHHRLDIFQRSSDQASSFNFNCDYEDGAVPVRVLLGRIFERSDHQITKSILMHIRKAPSTV